MWAGLTPIEVHHFVGVAEGPVVQISHEHYDFEWLTPAEYVAKHLPESRDVRVRQWVEEMRISAELVERWMANLKAVSDIIVE